MPGTRARANILAAACVWLLFFDSGSSFQHFPTMGKTQNHPSRAGLSRRVVREGSILLAARALSSQTTMERTSHASQHEAAREAAEQEYTVNRGFAVDTLLQDYAALFESTCNFDIFSEDVILRDSKVTFQYPKRSSLSFESARKKKMLVFLFASKSAVKLKGWVFRTCLLPCPTALSQPLCHLLTQSHDICRDLPSRACRHISSSIGQWPTFFLLYFRDARR
jgi:hypothetical protein